MVHGILLIVVISLHNLCHDSPELVVSVNVPRGDAHQLVQVRGGGGHQVHAGAVDVNLIEDALPGDLGPKEAPTLERELTSFIPVTRKMESVTKLRGMLLYLNYVSESFLVM